MFRIWLLLAAGLLSASTYVYQSYGKEEHTKAKSLPPLTEENLAARNAEEVRKEERWVDSVFQKLSPEQRIGQLFMMPCWPEKGMVSEQQVTEWIKSYGVGGVIFFKSNPLPLARLANLFQSQSNVPLMVSIDGEWGPNMRVDSATKFPRQMTLGALTDNSLVYRFGEEVARQCLRLGINVNFAPAVDVNNNAANPVIGDRSFGEDRGNVTAKGFQYMMGMQDNGVMACAKHFPGHGDTDVDSHKDLPLIAHPRKRLDSIELYPFRELAAKGMWSMMIAHLNVPTLDPGKQPSSISKPIINGLLQNELGFEGLVFTDAMNMEGLTKYAKSGEVEVRALEAGVDVLLMPTNVPVAFDSIRAALKSGRLAQKELDDRCKKILKFKYRLGLTQKPKPVPLANLAQDLNNTAAQLLREEIIQNAVTLVKNPGDFLPLRRPDTMAISAVSIGEGLGNAFQETLESYFPLKKMASGKDISADEATKMLQKLKGESMVIVSLHGMSRKAENRFGVTESTAEFLAKLCKQNRRVAVVGLGNPYGLKFAKDAHFPICAYDDDPLNQSLAAQAIVGATAFRGKLPVTACPELKVGMGVMTEAFRLRMGTPELAGMDSKILNQIDTIAKGAIKAGAMPGCNVLVAKNGRIVFHRSYGHTTQTKALPQRRSEVYDLASVSKIASTTICVMKLYEEGKLALDKPLQLYLPELASTNKGNILLFELLIHQAGLQSWIPFYQATLDKQKKPDTRYYRTKKEPGFEVAVADRLYLRNDYVDSLWQRIYDSDLRSNKNYEYSDLGMLLTQRVIERVTGKTLDKYVAESFYQPMGFAFTGYNPYKHLPYTLTVPTEKDNYYRYQDVQGYVHDMAAAMFNGVGGHAGLFSSATELATIMQMLNNGGSFNGKQYLKAETVKKFTQFWDVDKTRRGLGFDKPEFRNGQNAGSNNCRQSSAATFGHTGFTGICAWSDPDNQLVYIFLSNRTYPTMENRKLINMDTRTKIQSMIYQAMGKK